MTKKIGGVKKSVAPITPADDTRAKLLTRCAAIQREILAAAQPDDEPFDDDPPDDNVTVTTRRQRREPQ